MDLIGYLVLLKIGLTQQGKILEALPACNTQHS
jgi:hypothetical protein